MKSLVVFYSLDGHTRSIAENIASETGADVFELKPVKSTGKSGFAKFFLGGMRASFNYKPKLLTPLPELRGYELIFIGTPVWASKPAPAVNTFMSCGDLTAKKIMLFSSSGGGDAGTCFAKMKSRLSGCQLLGEISFAEQAAARKDEVTARIKAWLSGTGIQKKTNGA